MVDASGEVDDHERIVDEREPVNDGFCSFALDGFEVVLLNQLVSRAAGRRDRIWHDTLCPRQ